MKAKRVLTAIAFVVGVNAIYGYSIKRIEANDTGVYGVTYGDSSVKIFSPKLEKSSLREIIYFHIIEKPNDDSLALLKESEGPDFDDSLRPFTNSHGYQFLKADPEKVTSKADDDDESDDNNQDDEDYELEEEKEVGAEMIPDEDDVRDGEIKKQTNGTKTTPLIALEETTKPTVDVATRIPDQKEKEADTGSTILPETDRIDDVVDEKVARRNQLFNHDREKYKKTLRPSTSLKRSKRESVKDIPEPPRLARLDYNSFPENIRKLIPAEILPEFTEDDKTKKQMENKMQEMFTKLSPASDDFATIPKVRTYGMTLKNDRGYIWNDLNTNPGVAFYMGESETVDEDKKEQIPHEELQEIHDETPIHNHLEPTEDENNRESTIENVFPQEVETDYDSDSYFYENHPDLEDIFVDTTYEKKPLGTERNLNKKGSLELNLPKNNEDNGGSDKNPNTENPHIKKKGKEEAAKAAFDTKNSLELKPPQTDEDPDMSERPHIEKKGKEEADPKTEIDTTDMKIPSLLDDLIKSDEFWKWLESWTSTYMELLMKHIRNSVKQEVALQMQILKKHENENTKKNTTDPKQEKPKKVYDDSFIKDGKITIDGKEIPLTNTSNFNTKADGKKALKGRKDNENTKHSSALNRTESFSKKKEMQAVYGNNVNNDKVTNIYIFYPNESADKILEELKPNNKTNVFINPVANKPTRDKDSTLQSSSEEKEALYSDKLDAIMATDKDSITESLKEKEIPINKPQPDHKTNKNKKIHSFKEASPKYKDTKPNQNTDIVNLTNKGDEKITDITSENLDASKYDQTEISHENITEKQPDTEVRDDTTEAPKDNQEFKKTNKTEKANTNKSESQDKTELTVDDQSVKNLENNKDEEASSMNKSYENAVVPKADETGATINVDEVKRE